MTDSKKEIIVFGGGCFWCTEAVFKMLKGVVAVEPGYAGGTRANPDYHNIGDHAEVIQIEYQPEQIKLENLLTVFFASHDPTIRQPARTTVQSGGGNDVGTQYRSIILYTTEEQKAVIEKFLAELNASSAEGRPIVTEIKPLDKFYLAEDYHQNYYANNPGNPYCEIVINPKLAKVQEKFGELLNNQTNL